MRADLPTRGRASRRDVLLGAAATGGTALLGGGGGAAAAGGLLEARGKRLVYNGSSVRLRGVAVGDPLLAREYRPTSDYRVIARTWRSNCVRVSVRPTTWRHDQADALRLLERDVAAALANRMWVVIDWHSIGWPGGYVQRPDPAWGSPPDLYDSDWDLARSFWRAMAGRYGADGRVAFELWNEPVFDPDESDVTPGAHWPELKARYESLIALIRGRGAPNLVLLGGDRWAYDLRGVRASPAAGSNVAYTWHVYAGHDGNNTSRWSAHLAEVDRAHPVVVTEWGFCASCDGAHFQGTPASFGRRFANGFLEGRSLSWTAWCWHPDWGPPMLGEDWRTANQFGRFVKAELEKGSQARP